MQLGNRLLAWRGRVPKAVVAMLSGNSMKIVHTVRGFHLQQMLKIEERS